MGTISSGIGLISGINTAELIDQLMTLQARPVAFIEGRIADLTAQQTGLLSISGYALAVENLSRALADEAAFNIRAATTSNENVLRATAGAGAPVGQYAFTVSRLVQSHQMISAGVADTDHTPLGPGTFTIEMGNAFLESDTPVSILNGQAGIDRGSIRITDRSGASAVINLSDVVTVTDILDRINSSDAVNVVASVSGGHLVITDQTGQTASNLVVANVGTDRTATSLGIASSVAGTQIAGSDLLWLTEKTSLSLLNDGNGVRHRVGFDDFRITQRDGGTIDVNVSSATTMGDVLAAINIDEENTGNLVAQLGADGLSIELVDSSSGGTALSVTALNGSLAASDLGIMKSVTGGGGTLSGDRLLAGLNSVLLRSLLGGTGVRTGAIRIVDRAGTESIVDLAGAQTVQDVIDLINAPGVAADVTASFNAAGNGLRITDNTASTANPLVVTNDGGSSAATDLGLDTTGAGVAASRVEGTDLDRRYLSETTRLDTLNGGQGITRGKFTITDSTGRTATVDLTQGNETTIGDVLQEINSRNLSLTATINAAGDGILLTDTGAGQGRLTVAEKDGGHTAGDLGILGAAAEGETTLDGSFEIQIELDADDTLNDLVSKITDAGIPVTAGIINDGSPSTPYRLSLVSTWGGRAGRILVDTGDTALSMSTLVDGQNATLLVGAGTGGEPLVITSPTNTITGVVQGLTLDLVSASAAPVTVAVTSDTEGLISGVQKWVDAINAALAGIDKLVAYDAETETGGVLQGDMTAQRVRSRLFNLITRRYTGLGSYASLRDVGITLGEDGQLTLNQDRLRQVLGNGLTHVRSLFATEDTGVASLFEDTLHTYTSDNPGLIESRVESLGTRIDLLTDQKAQYETRLAAERRRLELEFAQLEATLARLQDQQRSLGVFDYLVPSSGTGSVGLFGQ